MRMLNNIAICVPPVGGQEYLTFCRGSRCADQLNSSHPRTDAWSGCGAQRGWQSRWCQGDFTDGGWTRLLRLQGL